MGRSSPRGPSCGEISPHACCMWGDLPTCTVLWGGPPHGTRVDSKIPCYQCWAATVPSMAVARNTAVCDGVSGVFSALLQHAACYTVPGLCGHTALARCPCGLGCGHAHPDCHELQVPFHVCASLHWNSHSHLFLLAGTVRTLPCLQLWRF